MAAAQLDGTTNQERKHSTLKSLQSSGYHAELMSDGNADGILVTKQQGKHLTPGIRMRDRKLEKATRGQKNSRPSHLVPALAGMSG
jgi:hypothetical protein